MCVCVVRLMSLGCGVVAGRVPKNPYTHWPARVALSGSAALASYIYTGHFSIRLRTCTRALLFFLPPPSLVTRAVCCIGVRALTAEKRLRQRVREWECCVF